MNRLPARAARAIMPLALDRCRVVPRHPGVRTPRAGAECHHVCRTALLTAAMQMLAHVAGAHGGWAHRRARVVNGVVGVDVKQCYQDGAVLNAGNGFSRGGRAAWSVGSKLVVMNRIVTCIKHTYAQRAMLDVVGAAVNDAAGRHGAG